jgi:aspartate/methionine/tyrosine aminotransferase
MARIDVFEMERMQSLHWHEVEHDLSESGVGPLSIRELLGDDLLGRDLPAEEAPDVLDIGLGYPLSEGSREAREAIASWYPGASVDNVTVVNGGSEANLLVLWSLLEPGDRLAFMVPNYLQGLALGRHFGEATDTFALVRTNGRWGLDARALAAAVTDRTRVVMVCNPNNPTGAVLTEAEMDAVVEAARSAGAWLVADEIYRGAEVEAGEPSPTFWGRYERTIVTSGLSKAFAMPGLRLGWVVAPAQVISEVWEHHDYTTLTPGMLSDRLAALVMRAGVRERVLERTRAIIRRNLPTVEAWVGSHADVLTCVRPVAGAIAYVEYDLPVGSTELADRIRREQSVLLVPGDMFGLGKGFRVGFGFDPEGLAKALERVSAYLSG